MRIVDLTVRYAIRQNCLQQVPSRSWPSARNMANLPSNHNEKRQAEMFKILGTRGPTDVEVLKGPIRHRTHLSTSGPGQNDGSDPLISDGSRPQRANNPTRQPTAERLQGMSSQASNLDTNMSDTLGPLPSYSAIVGAGGGGRSGAGASGLAASSFHARNRSWNPSASGNPEARQWSRRGLGTPQVSGTLSSASNRFLLPLAAEGEGSVFPAEISLAQRRQYEEEIIQRFDRLNINRRVGEFWFIIDADWMRSWVNFLIGTRGPPGPITNDNLFDHIPEGKRRESVLVAHASMAHARSGVLASRPDLRLREKLMIVRDYRVVHPVIWYILREMYDTDDAPDICRWSPDIYSEEVTATRKVRIETEAHTKAVYELRRFVARIKEDVAERSEQGKEEEERGQQGRRGRGRRTNAANE